MEIKSNSPVESYRFGILDLSQYTYTENYVPKEMINRRRLIWDSVNI